jgi:hypothetical protein
MESKIVCEWNDIIPECIDSAECSSLKGEGLICENYKSQKGICFFNGDGKITTNEKSCSDSMDIINCNQFTSLSICIYANKNLFTKFPGNLQNPCTWDPVSGNCNEREEPTYVDNVCIYSV